MTTTSLTNHKPVSYLFVPALELRKVEKALASPSDVVILDLEDSIPESQKHEARTNIRSVVSAVSLEGRRRVWVRINAATTRHFEDDLQLLAAISLPAVVPKAESPTALFPLRGTVPRIILLIETVVGLSQVGSLVKAIPEVERVAIGTWDLALDLGLFSVDPDESELIWQLRGQLVVESRRLGLKPPVDGIFSRVEDDTGLRAVCERAFRLGFSGKMLVHPRQLSIVQAAFSIDPLVLQSAQEIVQAYEEAVRRGRGATRIGGHAIDLPMVLRARAMLAHWGAL